jgi:formyl-CoA transferase
MDDGPLSGVRVLELGSLISGPFAARVLADFGARVIKVEPLDGDPLRQWGVPATADNSYWSLQQSRNKDLLAVDLHRREGQDLVRKLAGHVDVVLENFRPGRLEQWGLDYESLSRLYPDLIMVSISGYGQAGPYRERPGFGNIAEAMGGLRAVTGYEDGPPLRVGVSLGDHIASLHAVMGAVMALYRRQTGGGGDHVDVALTEAVLSFTEAQVPEFVHRGVVPRRLGNQLGRAAPSGTYPTADGGFVAIGANADSIFQRFAREIGRDDWAEDETLRHNAGRVQRRRELDDGITAYTCRHTMQEIVEAMARAEVPCGPVYTVREIVEDPHYHARHAIVQVNSPETGEDLTMLGVFPVLKRHPGRVRHPGGPIGRDTRQVLTELLGLSGDELADLERRGVVRCAPPST